MRALLLSIVAGALGVAAAWGATTYEFRKPEQVVPVRDPTAAQAKVVVEGGSVFHFGTMQVGDTQKHVFVLRNIGNAPLELTAGQPSCKCTVSEFSAEPVAPGESREVLLTWKPAGAEEKFRQRAPIFTNDPEQREITLSIAGRVAEFFKLEPNPLSLGHFSPTETSTHEINVWGYQPTPWKFKGYECLEADNAEFFSIAARDMTAEEIARSAGAVNGQVLTLTVKAGLPLGSVRQRVSITSHDEQSKPAELSITGKAVGDISVVGKEFNGDGDYVDLGNIPASAGKKSRLSLLVKGAHRSQVKFTIKGVDPQSSLRVTLGEPLPQGKSVSWPLVLEIPPDTEPVNRLGSELGRLGRIELETGTSEVPPCVVRVRFAVTAE
jgi:hypothetical protein